MNENLKGMHVSSVILLNMILCILIICSDNPLILFGLSVIMIYIFIRSRRLKVIKKSIMYFFPFAIITVIINLIFVNEGNIVILTVFNRIITIEALIYSLTLSFKLLLVIFVFAMFQVMIDSDKAISFFSKIVPKTTLTMMIALKLFPSMQKRMNNLKDIYSIRGVNFETKGIKDVIRNLKPLFSVILEDSLENSFDIGEAAYIRGFLSNKRTIYDRKHLNKGDYAISISVILILIIFLTFKFLGMDNFNAYYGINLRNIVDTASSVIFVSLILLTFELHLVFYEEKIK